MARLGAERRGATPGRAGKLSGVHLAIVTVRDPASHKVKLSFPWLPDSDESTFARVLVRGAPFLPEVGDQVIVVFEQGDIGRPIVLGGMWSTVEPPPVRNRDGKNALKAVVSKSGHTMLFDDTEGKERLVVTDGSQATRIELDAAAGVTRIRARGDIVIRASGAVRIHGRAVVASASGPVRATAGSRLDVGGQGGFAIGASGTMSLGAPNINLNGGGALPTVPLGAVAPAVASAAQRRAQVREQMATGGATAGDPAALPPSPRAAGDGAGGATSLARAPRSGAGSPAAQAAASASLSDELAARRRSAAYGTGTSTTSFTPGDTVTTTASVDGARHARYEAIDADTGEVLERGNADVDGDRATARWNTGSLTNRPDTSRVKMRMITDGGASSESPIMIVKGREGSLGNRSPSSDLADPRLPLPASSGGGRMRVGSAVTSAIEGDGAGVAGATFGQSGASAAGGDASGLVGGGVAGAAVRGDGRAAAVQAGGAVSAGSAARVAADGGDDPAVVGRYAENEARDRGEAGGIGDARRDVRHERSELERDRREIAREGDVVQRGRFAEQDARGEVAHHRYGAEREVREPLGQASTPPQEYRDARQDAFEGRRAGEREVERPENELRNVKMDADAKADVARDPEGEGARRFHSEAAHVRHDELGEVDANVGRAERAADDPKEAGLREVRQKLDEE